MRLADECFTAPVHIHHEMEHPATHAGTLEGSTADSYRCLSHAACREPLGTPGYKATQVARLRHAQTLATCPILSFPHLSPSRSLTGDGVALTFHFSHEAVKSGCRGTSNEMGSRRAVPLKGHRHLDLGMRQEEDSGVWAVSAMTHNTTLFNSAEVLKAASTLHAA